jgi:hypothetical protein
MALKSLLAPNQSPSLSEKNGWLSNYKLRLQSVVFSTSTSQNPGKYWGFLFSVSNKNIIFSYN